MRPARDLTPGFSLPKKKVIDIQVLDATSVRLLGKDTKMDKLPKQLAQKLTVYKSLGVSEHAVVAQIGAGEGVKMATVQDVQNILREAGILKVQYLPDNGKASEAPIF